VLTTHSHLVPRLKKEYSYTSTPLLGLHGLFYGELCFALVYFTLLCCALPFFTLPYFALLYLAFLYFTLLCFTLPFFTLPYFALLYFILTLLYFILTLLYFTRQYLGSFTGKCVSWVVSNLHIPTWPLLLFHSVKIP